MKSTKPKERREKICLNCQAELHGLYCHVCGQKNIEPRRPLWEIPWAFIEDMINVDGKFLKSIRQLLFFPGHLSKAYIDGKRHTYNDPVRMYLVTSFVFFIVAAFVFNRLKTEIDQTVSNISIDTLQLADTVKNTNGIYINTNEKQGISYTYSPSSDSLSVKESAGNAARMLKEMIDNTKTNLPYLLWISLPLFALVLKLLYIRRKIFYWDHLIFSLTIYSFDFLLLSLTFLVYYAITWIFSDLNPSILSKSIGSVILIVGSVYVFRSLKTFYGQKIGKTLVKFLLMSITAFFLFTFILVGFLYIYYTFIATPIA